MIPAMHGAESCIPELIWKSTPPSTNLGEAAHRDIQIEGTHLSLLAAVITGRGHDLRVRESFHALEQNRVEARFTVPSTFTVAARNDQRKGVQALHYFSGTNH